MCTCMCTHVLDRAGIAFYIDIMYCDLISPHWPIATRFRRYTQTKEKHNYPLYLSSPIIFRMEENLSYYPTVCVHCHHKTWTQISAHTLQLHNPTLSAEIVVEVFPFKTSFLNLFRVLHTNWFTRHNCTWKGVSGESEDWSLVMCILN